MHGIVAWNILPTSGYGCRKLIQSSGSNRKSARVTKLTSSAAKWTGCSFYASPKLIREVFKRFMIVEHSSWFVLRVSFVCCVWWYKKVVLDLHHCLTNKISHFFVHCNVLSLTGQSRIPYENSAFDIYWELLKINIRLVFVFLWLTIE